MLCVLSSGSVVVVVVVVLLRLCCRVVQQAERKAGTLNWQIKAKEFSRFCLYPASVIQVQFTLLLRRLSKHFLCTSSSSEPSRPAFDLFCPVFSNLPYTQSEGPAVRPSEFMTLSRDPHPCLLVFLKKIHEIARRIFSLQMQMDVSRLGPGSWLKWIIAAGLHQEAAL